MADARKKAAERGVSADALLGAPEPAAPFDEGAFAAEALPDPDEAPFEAGPVPEGFNDVPPIGDDEAYAFESEPQAESDDFDAAAYDALRTGERGRRR